MSRLHLRYAMSPPVQPYATETGRRMVRHLLRRRKRLTLRQRILIGVTITTVGTVCASYALSYTDHEPCADIAIALITAFGATFAAYMAADTADHASANKHGIDLSVDVTQDEESDGCD